MNPNLASSKVAYILMTVEYPASNLSVERFVLSAMKPQVLHVPATYASANMSFK